MIVEDRLIEVCKFAGCDLLDSVRFARDVIDSSSEPLVISLFLEGTDACHGAYLPRIPIEAQMLIPALKNGVMARFFKGTEGRVDAISIT